MQARMARADRSGKDPVRRALIGGIGNVLLGDDGVGPYILRLLDSRYCFGDDVELADLGTPALDLTHQIVGLRSLILIDSVASDENAPGMVVLYRKEKKRLSASLRRNGSIRMLRPCRNACSRPRCWGRVPSKCCWWASSGRLTSPESP